MLLWRFISAFAFLTPLVALFVVDYHYCGAAPGIWLLPITLLVAALAAGEFVDLITPVELRLSRILVQAGVVIIVLSSAAPLAWGLAGVPYPADCPLGKLGWPLTATAGMVTLILLAEMRRFERPGNHILRVALATFALVYLGLFLSFLFPLRSLGGNQWGMAAVISVLLIVKSSDIGAYTFGKTLGRTRLVPRLSPGKTVAGAVGGLATAAIVSLLFFSWAVPRLVADPVAIPAWRCLVYGMVLGIAAMVGDLAESLMKRDMGRKDSSSWLPGLGGILDLLDSVLVAAPTAYACWAVGLLK